MHVNLLKQTNKQNTKIVPTLKSRLNPVARVHCLGVAVLCAFLLNV